MLFFEKNFKYKIMYNKILAISFLFILIFFSNFFSAKAQKKLEHKKKIYLREDGRMFINKDLPVYLWISTDKKENPKLLNSESTPEYANPMYFDTEGWNTVRSPSAVDKKTKTTVIPEQDIVFNIFADSEAPHINIDFGKSVTHKKDNVLYCGKNTEIKLIAKDSKKKVVKKDETSGVENIYISEEKKNFKIYENSIKVDHDEIEYFYKFYAVDNVGNVEITKTLKFILDISPPITKLNLQGDQKENIISGRTKIILRAEDKISGVKYIYYQIDDNKKKHFYRYPFNLEHLSEGNHKIKYYSIDNVENEEKIKIFNFFLDKSPPKTLDEVIGNKFFANGVGYSSGRTKFKINAVDNKAGLREIYYSLGGKEYQIYEKPFYLPTKSGNFNIKYYAVDFVNNSSRKSHENKNNDNSIISTNNRLTYVDLTGPKMKYSFEGAFFKTRDTIFISNKTMIKLNAIDKESGVQYITYGIDGEKHKNYNGKFHIESKGEGLHKVNYKGFDNVENSNTDDFFFVTDNTGPDVYERFSTLPIGKKTTETKSVDVYSDYVILFLSATDKSVGFSKIYYSINGAKEEIYKKYISEFKKGRDYIIEMRALDYLGNYSKIKSIEFSIENE
ncbi:MAG: hypothetical protein B6I24_02970 [Bacteroidetes bacterium 4572_128]|nr:MAG: hypothetical protein B6I24_02970 [Bacteroidetes bacterium 4572_128]